MVGLKDIIARNRKRNFLYTALMMLTLTSCELIDIHPYDGKVEGDTNINGKNIAMIESTMAGRDRIRFAMVSDTQGWHDETEDMVADINRRPDIDFVIHCGDITNYGITKEFEWQRAILQKLRKPFVVLLGNHDCLGSGKNVYRTMFGPENFSFIAGPTRFICLDTNALEYDFSNPVPDLNFIRKFKGDESAKNTVIAMHIRPFAEEFNNNVADAFNNYVLELKNPLFCIYGHDHATQVDDLFNNGLLYYQITCAANRQYYIFTVTEGGYDHEIVDY